MSPEKSQDPIDDGVAPADMTKGSLTDQTKDIDPGPLNKSPIEVGRSKKALRKYMKMQIEGRGDYLIDELWKIALYDPELAEKKHNERHKDNPKPPTFKPWVTITAKQEAIKLLIAYEVGNPTQKVEKDEKINVEVNHKVTSIAKLIDKRKDELKLIEGGKQDDDQDIIEAEVVNDN
jgi:hypothetical protein